MNSLEVNKACAAVLVAGITFMVSGVVGDALVRPKRLDHTAIKIDTPAAGGAAPAVAEAVGSAGGASCWRPLTWAPGRRW